MRQEAPRTGAAAIPRGEHVRVVALRGHVLEVEAFAVEAALPAR